MEFERLNEMIFEQYIRVNKHPELDLFIYNYTPKAQYNRVWNEVTLASRGLIMDGDGKVVARPFPKFFNYGEMENQEIPTLPFEVFEKMDGSLGITYWVGDEVYLATRGSFNSDQAIKAMELLNSKYAAAKSNLEKGVTYLFEIIYPENRIVVDYGVEESLTLLAMIDTATGEELDLEPIGFPLVKKYDGLTDLDALKQIATSNKEGFVVKFENNFRVKIKFEEYVRLHRILTQVSSINIWEYLMSGESMEELLEHVPDEFYDWVKLTKNNLETAFREIEATAKSEFKTFPSRKETALYFMTCQYPKVLFAMLDERPYDEAIWRMIRPTFEKPFDLENKV